MMQTAQQSDQRLLVRGTYEQVIPPNPSFFSGLIDSLFGATENPARRAVIFTATAPLSGVSWISSAIAAAMASTGRKVLLADAEVVASFHDVNQAISLCQRVGFRRTWVLGQQQARHVQLPFRPYANSPQAVLYALLERYPHIILDAPALNVSDVALQLSPLVAGSVLVVREGRTEKQSLIHAHDLLTSLGGNVLGSVYNAH